MKAKQPLWRVWILAMNLVAAGHAFAQDELADLPDPTRPSTLEGTGRGAAAAPANQTARLTLESTIVSGDRRLAIINGKTLAVGAFINGARIKDIAPYRVELEQGGRLVTLKLVEDSPTRRHEQKEAAR
jgi:MSHA biogenesis protein MshK